MCRGPCAVTPETCIAERANQASGGDGYAIDMPTLRPTLAPGFVGAGARCASGMCEDPTNCPQCAGGMTCNVPSGMMCAGTCYGTCSNGH